MNASIELALALNLLAERARDEERRIRAGGACPLGLTALYEAQQEVDRAADRYAREWYERQRSLPRDGWLWKDGRWQADPARALADAAEKENH